jgi:hypothetical protein
LRRSITGGTWLSSGHLLSSLQAWSVFVQLSP